MRVLMISVDKGLVGGRPLGDVVERHKKYGEAVECLDIIVLCKKGYKALELSVKAHTYPTNSWFKLLYFRDALNLARHFFRKSGYDLIVTQDPFVTGLVGLVLKREFGAKLLVHFHGDYKFFFKTVVDGADAVRVMSLGQKEKLIRRGIEESKIRVISTPVDISRFENFENHASESQKKLKDRLKRQKGFRKIILFVARQVKIEETAEMWRKAIEIVKAKKGRDNVGLWLVGTNKSYEGAADMVTGVGSRDLEDLPVYYHTSDIVILPTNSESFGKVLVEANACGKPAVATATTGAREIIQDGVNGFLVPVGDAQAMAEKVLFLIEHPQETQRMGENGRRMAMERYGGNLQKVIDLWRQIAEKT